MTKHIILLIDIDKTLIDPDLSDNTHITWTGGNPEAWINQMKALRISASKMDIKIHFGIATLRSCKNQTVSMIVDQALKEYIDPDLVFFTNHKCKNIYALVPAALHLMGDDDTIFYNDIWIIDDRDSIVNIARSAGFNAVHAKKLTEKSIQKQKDHIFELFQPIHEYIIHRTKDDAPEIPLVNITTENLRKYLTSYIDNQAYHFAKLLLRKRPEITENWFNGKYENFALHYELLKNTIDFELIKQFAQDNDRLKFEDVEKKFLLLALYFATTNNQFDSIEIFLRNYIDMFNPDQLGRALLDLVSSHQYDLAKLLLEKRPDTKKKWYFTNNGNHAIHLALLEDNPDLELIELLAQNNENLALENTDNKNVLDIAVDKSHYKIISILLNNYIDLFNPDQLGKTLLDLVNFHQYDLAKLLLVKRPDTKKKWYYTSNGNHAIHLAVLEDNPDLELIKLLLQDNNKLHRENLDKETVMHIARRKNHKIVEEFLFTNYPHKFSFFCDKNIKNQNTLCNEMVQQPILS